jgi:hypothetical protein
VSALERAQRAGVTAAALLMTALVAGCSDGRRYEQAICVLIDVSGTYADEKAEVASILKREVLPAMLPGDTLLVIRIDSGSYEKDNIEALVTLDPRPSHANAQKLALARRLDAFAAEAGTSDYTDILGAMLLGSEYLNEMEAESRVMLVFSDLEQDLPAGARRRIEAGEFDGIQVVAMNVKRLHSDNADPEAFRGRLASWEGQLLGGGAAGWRAIMDAAQLPVHLAQLR